MSARANSAAAFVALAAFAGSGCGISSSYVREEMPDGELQWHVREGKLSVTKGSVEVGHERSWGRLPDAVACVEEARVFADDAAEMSTWGEVLIWTSVGVLVVGSMAGVGFGVVAGLTSGSGVSVVDATQRVGTVMLGTWAAVLLIGAAGSQVGVGQVDSSLPMAMDAVNAYNDKYQTTPACGGDS